MKFSGTFTEIRKKNSFLYNEPLKIVIEVRDPSGKNVSDIIEIEVDPSSWYILKRIIYYFSILITAIGFYKYRDVFYAVLFKKHYQYHRPEYAQVGM